MNAEMHMAQQLEGKFFLINGKDRNAAAQRMEQSDEQVRRIARKIANDKARQALAAMKEKSKANTRQYQMPLILLAVAVAHGVTVDDIKGASRANDIMAARKHACALIRRLTGATVAVIGSFIGRDHSTVSHSIGSWQQCKDQFAKAEAAAMEMLT